ncbi:MAG: putative photosynthetic complex assembly protein PuhE [Pseudomonadota bacterium]
MAAMTAPFLIASLLWWASTGAVLWLVRRSPATYKQTAWALTALALAAMLGLVVLRGETSVAAAYGGFAIGLVLWAWHEAMFLLGFVSGSRRAPCPKGLPTLSRFLASTQAVIHHEIGIAVHAVVIALLSWGADNQFAALTFFLLWVMRLSAKLVVFFGAPNVSATFLPGHLQYLDSYFNRNRNMTVFAIAFTLAVTITGVAISTALQMPAYSFSFIGYSLLASLAGLAAIEHLALVLPLPDAALWSWLIKHPTKTPEETIGAEWRRV